MYEFGFSPVTKYAMTYFSTVFGQYLAPLGHARLMCIHSAGCPYPSLNGIFVAPSREFKSLLNRKAMQYFKEMFGLFPESFRPEKRKGYKAYDGLNNTFNLAYKILSSKVMTALIKAKLEPHLGFLHSVQYGKPSLVCDFMELYRYLVDDFLIEYCRRLDVSDFVWKDDIHAGRKGKRAFLNKARNKEFLDRLEDYFQTRVNVPRVRMGKKQELETVINEEAMLLASFIRGKRIWEPRLVPLPIITIPKIQRKEKRKTKTSYQPFFPKL